MPFISQKNIWFCGARYEMLNIYLVCEWKLFSADDWSSDCRCHGCVSCVQFSVRIRCDLCSTLSPLPLFILTNLHMNVWVWSLLEVLTVCSQWERLGRHMAAEALIAPTQWAHLWGAGGGRLRGMKTDSASGLWMWEICDLVKWSKWLQVASVFKAQFIVFFTQGTKLSRCLLGVRHEPQGIYSMFCKLFKGKELCHIYTYIFLFIYVFSYLVSYHSRYNYDMFHIKATNKYNNEYNKIYIIYLFSFFIYFLFCVFQASAIAN